MGGAQAGEIASRMTAEAFAEADLIDGAPADVLRETIGVANTRILERSRTDPDAAGMGTTVTAALVADDGTSPSPTSATAAPTCYATASLQRLTDDHSLVGELVRKGELTEAEAEHHPQRSVITRALGTDADVRVDTFTVHAQRGDMVLLCSDGLNTMVDEHTIARVALGRRHGGGDRPRAGARRAAGRRRGQRHRDRVPDRRGRRRAGGRRRRRAREHPALLSRRDDDEGGGPRLRTLIALLGVGVLAVGLAAAALVGLRESHFIGADTSTGQVAVYQGVPIDLPFGIHLYHVTFDSTVSYAALTARQRQTLFDHTLRTESGAMATLQPYEVASP